MSQAIELKSYIKGYRRFRMTHDKNPNKHIEFYMSIEEHETCGMSGFNLFEAMCAKYRAELYLT